MTVQHTETIGSLVLYTIEDGQIFLSPEFTRGLMRALRRDFFNPAGSGEYLRLVGQTIAASRALPVGNYQRTAGPVVLTTAEQAVATVALTPQSSGSRVLLLASCNARKDGGTTRRGIETRIRRNGVAMVGPERVAWSQNVASSPIGPLAHTTADNPATDEEVTYTLTARTDGGSPEILEAEIIAMEVE